PRAESGTVLVGSPRLVALPGGPLGAVSVSGPVGAPVRATPEELAAGARSWRFAATDASGVYRVRIEGKGGDELASDAFAVGVDPRESDLALLPAERLAALLRGAGSAGEGAGGPGGTSGAGTGGRAAAAGGARGGELGATPPNGTGLWGWLALAFLALLPVESWLARAIRARPRPPAPVAPAGRAAGRA
ncbi:MAG TPA: hypothetical protein VG389_28470, partial [Myxococcota bacterium]|nr:hypothetical protein [Myxococcota bacterium]